MFKVLHLLALQLQSLVLCRASTCSNLCSMQAGKSYGSPREAILVNANFLVDQLRVLKLASGEFTAALLAAVSLLVIAPLKSNLEIKREWSRGMIPSCQLGRPAVRRRPGFESRFAHVILLHFCCSPRFAAAHMQATAAAQMHARAQLAMPCKLTLMSGCVRRQSRLRPGRRPGQQERSRSVTARLQPPTRRRRGTRSACRPMQTTRCRCRPSWTRSRHAGRRAAAGELRWAACEDSLTSMVTCSNV